jgi:predicted ester cyclase
MSTEHNKALARRILEEIVTRGNMSLADELIAPDYVGHPTPPGMPPGREGLKLTFTMYLSAFPDMKTTIDDIFAEGDKVVFRATHSATHKGEFMGIPPTGKSVSFEEISIMRFAEGMCAEYWGLTDSMTMMQQLGAIPAPGQSGS